ncbi:hypothetical protein KBB06_02900 [Candidatus Gracilibacteria bacterium]|nr:hypothetical protein [Candidatus Gracilibacteria bacterium]
MKDLSQEILDTIKKEHIKPLPKWRFVLQKSFIWAMFVFCVLLGGLAFSSIIFHVNDVDLDVYSKFNSNFMEMALSVIPYFWVVLMCLFLFAAYYNFKHTDGGYKYGTTLILLASIVGSLLVGLLIYYVDFNEPLEENVMEHVPFYNMMMPPKAVIWNRPEMGFLTGTIKDFKNGQEFDLIGVAGDLWIVNYTEAKWQNGAIGIPGMRVKMLGVKDGENHFTASDIRPWFKLRTVQTVIQMQIPGNRGQKNSERNSQLVP